MRYIDHADEQIKLLKELVKKLLKESVKNENSMINWKELQENYPKAIELLERWGNYPAVISRQKFRLLFDFFDSNGIYIEVCVDKTMEAKFCCELSWENDFNWRTTGYSDLFYTRYDAEMEGFEKAFEILEKKL